MISNSILRGKVAKYVGYPLQDYAKRTDILGTLSFLRESQYWEESRIEEYRLEKLRKLVVFAHRNVPYYQNLFRSLKFDVSELKHFEDLNKIPILTKDIVRRENMNLVAQSFNSRYIKKGKTGGTTGSPILVFKDTNNRSFTWASYYRWYDWMGIKYYETEVTFWGARTVLEKSFKKKSIDRVTNFLQNCITVNSFNMNETNLYSIYNRIKQFNPRIIKGYLSALVDLANYIESNSLEKLIPRAISSTSESLLPHNREHLEKAYEAPMYDQYGCGEISAISYECPKHNGLHINQEHVICEIIDQKGHPLLGKCGRIIATDLDNFIMPFIRYENGDLASLLPDPCTCGVNQPLMSSIDGRSIDTITLKDGSKVHGVFFTDIFYELGIHANVISRFQVYQTIPGVIEFRCENVKPLDKGIKEKLHKSLLSFFHKVTITESSSLQSGATGKFQYIINEIEEEK